MSSNGIQEALLLQRLEFLQIELDDAKKREQNLKKVNESLLQAMTVNDPNPIKDHTIEELQKSNEQLMKDIQQTKARHKEQINSLEKQNNELSLSVKELQLDLKHQKVIFESEKFDLLSRIQKLEADKLSLEQSSKVNQDDKNHGHELYKLKTELKMQDVRREADILKEESRNEILTVRQEADAAILELKTLFNKENEALRAQIKNLQAKLRQQSGKMDRYQNEEVEGMVKKIDELEVELDKYRSTRSSPIHRMQETEKSFRINLTQTENELSGTLPEINEWRVKGVVEDRPFKSSKELTPRLNKSYGRYESMNTQQLYEHLSLAETLCEKKDKEIKDLKMQIEKILLQKERIQLELDRIMLELKQNKLDKASIDQKRNENEQALKNEIKFLIGKLLKAKSKLAAENELSETIKREGIYSTSRSKSNLRTKLDISRASPNERPISPLNLSIISRSESPFGVSEYDLNRY
ncbi:unnamed protein product [Blepharisma stoltei]|uniref:Uncharacterized protein n=1 Tax=Blepharisma stoltei TaxID=1481888 RepID=A0AAU9IY01_9CILI|nr:unnamed protein product [Blepharisma stoltei]